MRALNNVQVGTFGGTLCSLWGSFDWNNLLTTALMAVVGAIVSYMVSWLLQDRRRK